MNHSVHNVRHDQAEGLRRLFATPKPRVVTVLSNLSDADKDLLLVNLSAALERTGSEVLLVDARSTSSGIADRVANPKRLSLAEAICGNVDFKNVFSQITQGCRLMTLMPKRETLNAADSTLLAQAFENTTRDCGFILIDGETAKDDPFPLTAMEEGDIVLQLSSNQASIKSAYALLKRLNARLGRRPFSILVTGASEREAGIVSHNLVEAANRYLAISLNPLGWVPADIQIDHAAKMGKSVVNAFPLADAAIAFKRIAENLVAI